MCGWQCVEAGAVQLWLARRPRSAAAPCMPPLLPLAAPLWAQAEAERQRKIEEEVKRELRMFYCSVS